MLIKVKIHILFVYFCTLYFINKINKIKKHMGIFATLFSKVTDLHHHIPQYDPVFPKMTPLRSQAFIFLNNVLLSIPKCRAASVTEEDEQRTSSSSFFSYSSIDSL